MRGHFSHLRDPVDEELPRGLVAFSGADGRRQEGLRSGMVERVTRGGGGAGSDVGATPPPLPTVVLDVEGRRLVLGSAADGDGSGDRAGMEGGAPGHPVEGVDLSSDALALVWAGEGPATLEAFLEAGVGVLTERAGSKWVDDALGRLGRAPVGGEPAGGPGPSQDGQPDAEPPTERRRVEAELREVRERIALLEALPARLRTLEMELRELRADAAEVAGDLEVATMDWLRERQDAETHLQAYRDRARELKARLAQTESGGDETPCPTCGRPLGDHLEEVLRELREEWESVVQDGQWWKRRRGQLDLKPPHLQELEGRSLRVHAAVEESAERAQRLRVALDELGGLRAHEATLAGRLRELREEGGEAVGEGGASEEPGEDGIPEEGGAAGDGRGLGTGGGEDVLRAALLDVRREITGEARERLLSRAGLHLNRLSGGRILALQSGEGGGLLLVGVGEVRPPAGEEERAAVRVALHVALAELVATRGGVPLESLVVDRAFDRMEEEARLRGVDLLVAVGRTLPQVLLFARSDVADRRPESFTAVYEFRAEELGLASCLRSLPAGVGVLDVGVRRSR